MKPDREKIDRNKILDKLAEKDYVDILHRQIKEGLIGTLRNEYMLTKPMRDVINKNQRKMKEELQDIADRKQRVKLYFRNHVSVAANSTTSEVFDYKILD